MNPEISHRAHLGGEEDRARRPVNAPTAMGAVVHSTIDSKILPPLAGRDDRARQLLHGLSGAPRCGDLSPDQIDAAVPAEEGCVYRT